MGDEKPIQRIIQHGPDLALEIEESEEQKKKNEEAERKRRDSETNDVVGTKRIYIEG